MIVQLTMIARYLILLTAVTLDTEFAPPTPALVLLLVLLSATALVPALRLLVREALRALSASAHGPPAPAPGAASGEVRTPTDPGTPGTVRARAPSHGVHAFA